jgi:FKBP-type peptidyl-prolyl cis-trans isomerase
VVVQGFASRDTLQHVLDKLSETLQQVRLKQKQKQKHKQKQKQKQKQKHRVENKNKNKNKNKNTGSKASFAHEMNMISGASEGEIDHQRHAGGDQGGRRV